MKFQTKLDAIIEKNNSLVCIGLDSALEKLPAFLKVREYPLFDFNKALIDKTADLVCAYKPNSAYYEAQGEAGIRQLKMTIDYLKNKYPDVCTILDAKRADIGNTNKGYVNFVFDWLGFDAITLHPYLGQEALQPFLDHKEKGCIILCRTSNPGAGEFQDLETNNVPLWMSVAKRVSENWNQNENCMLVVGATYPTEIQRIRSLVGEMTFLVPGVGAQGGQVSESVLAGRNKSGKGLMISSSRAIIFASNSEDFADAARRETLLLKDEINKYR